MKAFEKNLLETIAEEHNVSSKTLQDILKSANNFSYERTLPGKRIDEYYGLIKYAINSASK
ncbi:hypothetical protein [Lysinibacillus fusiformis]|uniref:hypothetical protein n=1 Tax=Lysinibacillus fusiformis TaxID=28031 RepID=UPI003CFEB011